MDDQLLREIGQLHDRAGSQGDRAIERAKGGRGIGLALVKRRVDMHGGSVEARSAGPGPGSEFSKIKKWGDRAFMDPPPPPPPPKPPGKK